MDDSAKRMDKPAGQNVQNIHVLPIIAHKLIHTSSTDALFSSNNKKIKKGLQLRFAFGIKTYG